MVGEAHAARRAEARCRTDAVRAACNIERASERRHDGGVDVNVPDQIVGVVGDERNVPEGESATSYGL